MLWRQFLILTASAVIVGSSSSACSYIFEGALPEGVVDPTIIDPNSDLFDAAGLAPPPDAAETPPSIAFCPSQTNPFLYCEDFDGEPPRTLAEVGVVKSSSGGLIEIANVVALSPPRSLLSTLPANPAGDSTAAVTHALGQSPEAVTLGFSVLVSRWQVTPGAPPLASSTTIAQIEIGPSCFVRVGGDATAWVVTQSCAGTDAGAPAEVVTSSNTPIDRGRWRRFSLSIQQTPAKLVTLSIDGVALVSVPAVVPSGPISIGLGIDRAAPGNAIIFEDNILVTSP